MHPHQMETDYHTTETKNHAVHTCHNETCHRTCDGSQLLQLQRHTGEPRRPRSSRRCSHLYRGLKAMLLFSVISVFIQVRFATVAVLSTISLYDIPREEALIHNAAAAASSHQHDQASPLPLTRLPKNESFGACLMLKDDNSLLYEWLAYHYTTLPLRYVYVGVDEGSTQDPEDVLRLWKTADTDLIYWITNATSFATIHGTQKESKKNEEEAHHSFIWRQKGFITSCTRFLRRQGLQWVTYIDSDEFVVWNRVHESEAATNVNNTSDGFQQRMALPPAHDNSHPTVIDAIKTVHQTSDLSACITCPRVLYGSLENDTCPEARDMMTANSNFDFSEMSTLRYSQHARQGDFSKNKFGKVFMDVSRLPNSSEYALPRNIHRPFKPPCRPGVVDPREALFYVAHYIGSWERYIARPDDRRNRREWEIRAYISDDTSCEDRIYQWFLHFLNLVGWEKARILLNSSQP